VKRAALATLLALAACSSLPDPGGARLERRGFTVASDSPDPAFVASWEPLVARDASRLEKAFGFELSKRFTAILCVERRKFEELARELWGPGAEAEGFETSWR
jgi:hypothetical protein